MSPVSTPEPRDALLEVERLRAEVVELRERTAQLQRALESRLDIPTDTAFTLLRRAARSEQMRIHDLAALVVGASATPPPVAREVACSRPEEV